MLFVGERCGDFDQNLTRNEFLVKALRILKENLNLSFRDSQEE